MTKNGKLRGRVIRSCVLAKRRFHTPVRSWTCSGKDSCGFSGHVFETWLQVLPYCRNSLLTTKSITNLNRQNKPQERGFFYLFAGIPRSEHSCSQHIGSLSFDQRHVSKPTLHNAGNRLFGDLFNFLAPCGADVLYGLWSCYSALLVRPRIPAMTVPQSVIGSLLLQVFDFHTYVLGRQRSTWSQTHRLFWNVPRTVLLLIPYQRGGKNGKIRQNLRVRN